METLFRYILLFFSILIGASLLSGAGVMFDDWYKFPKEISSFVVMIIVFLFLVKLSIRITTKK